MWLWRANTPAAAAMTMDTNPLTIGFWLWLVFQMGALALAEPIDPVPPTGDGALSWLALFDGPLCWACGYSP